MLAFTSAKVYHTVKLSSCQAEWISLSEAVKDIIFLLQVCKSMNIQVQLPVIVRVDNIGAIFLSENVTTSQNTKHVDIRSKFVRQFREDGIVKIIFVHLEGGVLAMSITK